MMGVDSQRYLPIPTVLQPYFAALSGSGKWLTSLLFALKRIVLSTVSHPLKPRGCQNKQGSIEPDEQHHQYQLKTRTVSINQDNR
jgi:hypothetical protein